LISIKPTGVYSWQNNGPTISDPSEVYEKLVRERKEIIEPLPTDTAEDLASLMSCAACDLEFPRVIVYPVEGQLRQDVINLLINQKHLYPMYEYLPANVITDNDLDSKSIIFKYKRSASKLI
jgi:hypothetical protein